MKKWLAMLMLVAGAAVAGQPVPFYIDKTTRQQADQYVILNVPGNRFGGDLSLSTNYPIYGSGGVSVVQTITGTVVGVTGDEWVRTNDDRYLDFSRVPELLDPLTNSRSGSAGTRLEQFCETSVPGWDVHMFRVNTSNGANADIYFGMYDQDTGAQCTEDWSPGIISSDATDSEGNNAGWQVEATGVTFWNPVLNVFIGTNSMSIVGPGYISVDLGGRRIQGLSDPVGGSDAVNLQTLQAALSGSEGNIWGAGWAAGAFAVQPMPVATALTSGYWRVTSAGIVLGQVTAGVVDSWWTTNTTGEVVARNLP